MESTLERLLGSHAENLAAVVRAALRADMVSLLHAAANRAGLNRGKNRLLVLRNTLTLAHLGLFMLG